MADDLLMWARRLEQRAAGEDRLRLGQRARRGRVHAPRRPASRETLARFQETVRAYFATTHEAGRLAPESAGEVAPPPKPPEPPEPPEPSAAQQEPESQGRRTARSELEELVARKVRLGLGLNLQETAAWFGGDRGTVAKHLTVVPMGEPGRVEVGRIPARQVGSRRFVLPGDVLGCGHAPAGTSPGEQEECHGQDDEEAPATTTTNRRDFDRSVDQLRHRRG